MTTVCILLGLIIGVLIAIHARISDLLSELNTSNFLQLKTHKELDEIRKILKEIKDNGPECRN